MRLFGYTLVVNSCLCFLAATSPGPEALRVRRLDRSDLEIRGILPNAKEGESRFISKQTLQALPQSAGLIKRDHYFPDLTADTVTVSGVELGAIPELVGLPAQTTFISAVCEDGYTAPFPPDYTHAHHPILVLAIDNITPEAWATKTHGADLGPYFVASSNFKPAFQVLSHQDYPQAPTQVIRLDFSTLAQQAAAFAPSTQGASNAQISDGYRISQQNCFRCHNAGQYGGTKAGRSWKRLAEIARNDPDSFAKWIKNPQSIDPKATMPPNPQYDRATLSALTAYFQNF